MQEELKQIDTAPIDALVGIQSEQDQLTNLLAKAEATKEKVSEAVFARVRKDYESRLEALEAKARPLREQARQQQARLRPLHDGFRRALEGARLDVEELQFRREVGELSEEDFGGRKKALDEALSRRELDFKEADALAERFVAVVGAAPEVVEPPPPPPEPEPETAPRIKKPVEPELETAPRMKVPPESEAAAPAPKSAPGSSSEETMFVRAPAEEVTAAHEVMSSTVTMRTALLVAESGKPPLEFPLGPRTSIGRIKDNELCIPKPSISRKHAVIALTADGYVISDLQSGNGTFVNDQKVDMHKLQNGDRIRLGDASFVFRMPD